MPLPPNTKKKNAPPLPPAARPAKVTVNPGKTVQIPLRTFGSQGRSIRYLLRSQPRLGEIVSMGPTDKPGVWVLTYRHTSAMSEGGDLQDRILFAAQDDEATSAPVEILITIADAPANLVAPAFIDFGHLPAGLAATRSFTLANEGGQILEGSIEVEGPWTLEPTEYRLARGAKQTFRLAFRPSQEGDLLGALRVSGLEKPIPIRAHVLAPFSAEPNTLELAANSENLVRSGTLTLRNHTQVDQQLTLTADPRLKLPAEVTLAPGVALPIPLALEGADPAALEGSLVVEAGGIRRTLPITAPEAGPRLRTQPGEVAFGKIPTGRRQEQRLRVENWGGLPAEVVAYISAPFEVEPADLKLAPGQSAEVLLTVSPAWAGPVQSVIKFQAGPVHLEIPVTAEATARAAEAAPQPTFHSGGPVPEEAPTAATLPALPPLETVHATTQEAQISWRPAPPGGTNEATPPAYRVEARSLRLDGSGSAKVAWVPMPNTTISEKNGGYVATITQIPKGVTVVLRVVTLDQEGNVSRFSGNASVTIAPPPVYFTTKRLLLAGFALLLGLGLWLRSGRAIFGLRLH